MEKATRAELIASLVTDKFSTFKDGDEAILEGASDARLDEFRVASEARRSTANIVAKMETENRNIAARLKVAEDRLKATEQELTEDEFLQRAPASIKAVVDEHRASEAAMRSALVAQLKDLGDYGEEDLKKKSTSELKTLASYARVQVPDFSGRGIALDRSTPPRVSYAPPNPYEEGLKALREKSAR